VEVGDFYKELGGVKHVNRTGDIGAIKIVTETSVAAGIRRIEAITGQAVIEYLRQSEKLIRDLSALLNANPENLYQKIDEVIRRTKNLEKEFQSVMVQGLEKELENQIAASEKLGVLTVFAKEYPSQSADDLKKTADLFREKVSLGVGLFISIVSGKPILVVTVTDAAIQKYQLNAGKIVKELGKYLGGGGGGRPHMATAGGKNPEKIPTVLEEFKKLIKRELNR